MTDYIEKLRYNSHDMGEMGKFIRLEYAENILQEVENHTIQKCLEEVEDCEAEHNDARHGVTPEGAYDRVRVYLKALTT